jgi:hypothetical protein
VAGVDGTEGVTWALRRTFVVVGVGALGNVV